MGTILIPPVVTAPGPPLRLLVLAYLLSHSSPHYGLLIAFSFSSPVVDLFQR